MRRRRRRARAVRGRARLPPRAHRPGRRGACAHARGPRRRRPRPGGAGGLRRQRACLGAGLLERGRCAGWPHRPSRPRPSSRRRSAARAWGPPTPRAGRAGRPLRQRAAPRRLRALCPRRAPPPRCHPGLSAHSNCLPWGARPRDCPRPGVPARAARGRAGLPGPGATLPPAPSRAPPPRPRHQPARPPPPPSSAASERHPPPARPCRWLW
mmetsp:Transcript_23354/g.72798  ORF Transcript_23354/g.72798 Transcript_23354/m.72798 type:complete len:211 (-) Transcript_23354:399-1031(-)